MVRMVETNRPPMIVAAIPANMASPNNGNIPKIVVPDAIVTGTIRVLVASITALTGARPLSTDLVHQHDRILDIHTDQT